MKFRGFPGGVAYENAFVRKVVDPIAKAFAACPEVLVEAGVMLGGRKLELGQAIRRGPPRSTTFQLPISSGWTRSCPPTANVLFDKTGNSYLNAEGLANLAETGDLAAAAAGEEATEKPVATKTASTTQ